MAVVQTWCGAILISLSMMSFIPTVFFFALLETFQALPYVYPSSKIKETKQKKISFKYG